MGEEVEVADLSDDAIEVLEWLADLEGVTVQEAVEMAIREGMRKHRERTRRSGVVLQFRQPVA